jgi:hypothetical protein
VLRTAHSSREDLKRGSELVVILDIAIDDASTVAQRNGELPSETGWRLVQDVEESVVPLHDTLSGTRIRQSCCSGVFVDQSAESVASVELVWRVRVDEV